ncbi:MAG: S10 family serine carboxypeptidase-like protein, partial [Acetobacteraceae bacterium]
GRRGRGAPDVAGNAAPERGYAIVVGGEAQLAAGTSAVAPLWAGLAARINQKAARPVGFFLPAIYGRPQLLTPVTQGSNRAAGSPIGYDAGPGWNACTGLGTPRGQALADALAGTATTSDRRPGATQDLRDEGERQVASHPTPAHGSSAADPAERPIRAVPLDQPLFDPVAYGNGPLDSLTDATERAAITHHQIVLDGKSIHYTATAGHLVTVDPSSSKPDASIFYVAFTADGTDRSTRPVTFFYNGGPGSSSVYVLLGSFAPMRIRTNLPGFTPPAPYTIETTPDSLLDRSDLVFINPVGTGYSAAIAPKVNKDFWGVDQDAGSIRQFIKRYLTANDRWNSPKFLFGESYGTARSAV